MTLKVYKFKFRERHYSFNPWQSHKGHLGVNVFLNIFSWFLPLAFCSTLTTEKNANSKHADDRFSPLTLSNRYGGPESEVSGDEVKNQVLRLRSLALRNWNTHTTTHNNKLVFFVSYVVKEEEEWTFTFSFFTVFLQSSIHRSSIRDTLTHSQYNSV